MDRTLFFVAMALAATVAMSVEASVLTDWVGSLRAIPDDKECVSKKELSCNGCNTQVSCSLTPAGSWLYLGSTNCSSATPYCEPTSGNCTANTTSVPSTCTDPQPVTTFSCQEDGYWPDLADCTKYFICADTKAYAMDCAKFPGTVYDHSTASCTPKTASNCFALKCPAAGSYVPYTPDPSIYAFCRSTSATNAVAMKCPSGNTLNAVSKACQPACIKAGRYAVAGEKKAYTECVPLSSNTLSAPTPGRCPGTFEFKKDTERCAAP